MAYGRPILFLCTGNYYRSRFAEHLFNHLAAQRRLPWRAESRGLAIELGVFNVGPISSHTLERLAGLEVDCDGPHRAPVACCVDDLLRAERVIALKDAEHRPLMGARFPAWQDRIEYWHVHDLDAAGPIEALAEIEENVVRLIDELAQRPITAVATDSGGQRG